MKKNKDFVITMIVGAVIALIVSLVRNVFGVASSVEFVSILSDSFFVSAVLLGGFGLLMLIANEGNFDTLAYGFKIIRCMFTRNSEERKVEKNLFEYRMAKNPDRKSCRPLIVSGILYLLLSGMFTMLFYWLY